MGHDFFGTTTTSRNKIPCAPSLRVSNKRRSLTLSTRGVRTTLKPSPLCGPLTEPQVVGKEVKHQRFHSGVRLANVACRRNGNGEAADVGPCVEKRGGWCRSSRLKFSCVREVWYKKTFTAVTRKVGPTLITLVNAAFWLRAIRVSSHGRRFEATVHMVTDFTR